jgi:hypothetical protein
MRLVSFVLPATIAIALSLASQAVATEEENAEDFMGIHKIEIIFHEAGTTKNLDLMLSLFADDATLTSGGKTYKGKDEIRSYWQAAGPFQPQNQWVAYTPAFRIKYAVEGDRRTCTSSASMWTKRRTTLQPTLIQTTCCLE